MKIPECPYCKKPTTRREGVSMTTCLYYAPTYNERGENINPDGNITTTQWTCVDCGGTYSTKSQFGNIIESNQ